MILSLNFKYRAAVKLPNGHDRNEWLAINTVDFYNQLNLIYGSITDLCTDESCPKMNAGSKYEYLLWPEKNQSKPQKCSAPRYVDKLLEWIEACLDDETMFPRDSDFPEYFEKKTVHVIFKRMFRVYAHIYHHHIKDIDSIDEQKYLNTCFKHFWLFCQEFKLIDEIEQRPLSNVIDQLTLTSKKDSLPFK